MASAPARISTPRCDGCPRLPQPLSSKLAVAARRLEPATFGQGKLFFVNILPVSPTNSIFCGGIQAGICRKSLYRNILCTPVEKIVVALGIINSLRSKILRVNYLESTFCEPNHEIETKQLLSIQYFTRAVGEKFCGICVQFPSRTFVPFVFKSDSGLARHGESTALHNTNTLWGPEAPEYILSRIVSAIGDKNS